MQRYGVKLDGASIDHEFVIERKNKVVKMLVGGIGATLKKAGIDVVNEAGEILRRDAEGFAVKAGGKEYIGKRLLYAPAQPPQFLRYPDSANRSSPDSAMTNHEILDLKEVPKNLVVIGGGVIGLEMASYFCSIGSPGYSY